TTINLLLQLSKLASNVSCVTVQHRCISSADLAWMVQNNPLGCEASCFHWWVTFAVTSHIVTATQRTSLTDTSLTLKPRLSPGRASPNASWCVSTDFTSVDTLTGAKMITRPGLRTLTSTRPTETDATQGFKQDDSTGIAIFTGDFPSLEPWKVRTWLQHVVTIPARNWHTCYCVGVVTNFLNVGADSLNNFLISLLAVE
ncbi:hypothetical protein Celaphus_00019503, partial [Cervus elaphus hippelaphus]